MEQPTCKMTYKIHADKDKNKIAIEYIGKFKLWFPGLEKVNGQMLIVRSQKSFKVTLAAFIFHTSLLL